MNIVFSVNMPNSLNYKNRQGLLILNKYIANEMKNYNSQSKWGRCEVEHAKLQNINTFNGKITLE